MSRFLAIDPGPEQSAYVEFDGTVRRWAKLPNVEMLWVVEVAAERLVGTTLAVEMIASYGMAVGAEVFRTCVWIGRFLERWSVFAGEDASDPLLVYRRDVKLHLCGSSRAKDPNVRQALIDLYGPGREKAIGTKASPGPLYGLAGDGWAALGVAVTAASGAVAA